MNIFISNTSNEPIYKQISIQIRDKILKGDLVEGESLPSMRLLAKELRVSVITTKKAYQELEKDGFINTFTGKGCFVATTNDELVREEHLKQIEEVFQDVVSTAYRSKITLKELTDLLSLIYMEGN